jgi:hypothetical protein
MLRLYSQSVSTGPRLGLEMATTAWWRRIGVGFLLGAWATPTPEPRRHDHFRVGDVHATPVSEHAPHPGRRPGSLAPPSPCHLDPCRSRVLLRHPPPCVAATAAQIAAAGGPDLRSAGSADAPLNQPCEAHLAARPLHSPEGPAVAASEPASRRGSEGPVGAEGLPAEQADDFSSSTPSR